MLGAEWPRCRLAWRRAQPRGLPLGQAQLLPNVPAPVLQRAQAQVPPYVPPQVLLRALVRAHSPLVLAQLALADSPSPGHAPESRTSLDLPAMVRVRRSRYPLHPRRSD
jgi:hypothetical protein